MSAPAIIKGVPGGSLLAQAILKIMTNVSVVQDRFMETSS
jgi:hypothetical protein